MVTMYYVVQCSTCPSLLAAIPIAQTTKPSDESNLYLIWIIRQLRILQAHVSYPSTPRAVLLIIVRRLEYTFIVRGGVQQY